MENEKVAPEWAINSLRKSVARDLASEENPYNEVLNKLREFGFFENWSLWEINNRPINLDDIAEILFT